MPLALDDNRWRTLKTAYNTPATEVAVWLTMAYRSSMNEELLGNIINDVQHQSDTSEAMFAVAPHLLVLSKNHKGDIALQMTVEAGLICGSSQLEVAVPCPADLVSDFENTKELGRKMTLEHLKYVHDFNDFKYLLAALSGFSNQGRFGRIIEGFDLYDNRFYHVLQDEPFDNA